VSDTYATVQYASLAGRTVLITGGASGIGAALVKAFTAQNSKVHFIDIDRAAGDQVAHDTEASFHPCDVTDISALREVIAGVEAEAGAVDVLVNNAGKDDRRVGGARLRSTSITSSSRPRRCGQKWPSQAGDR
jgi:NAD(P)-dependent dehydrogenase (short-subunit alcohol dehydrogenase family)